MNEQLHVSMQRIVAYFSGDLDEYELAKVERHLDSCDSCAARARRAYPLTEGWTASTHAAAVAAEARVSDPLVSALMQARRIYSQLDARLREWLAAPQAIWSTPGLTVTQFGTGAIAVRGAKTPVLQVRMPAGAVRARVVVRDAPKSIEVLVAEVRDPASPPAVILFAEDESTEPLVILLASAGERRGWVGQFDSVAPGEYLLALEPSAS